MESQSYTVGRQEVNVHTLCEVLSFFFQLEVQGYDYVPLW